MLESSRAAEMLPGDTAGLILEEGGGCREGGRGG